MIRSKYQTIIHQIIESSTNPLEALEIIESLKKLGFKMHKTTVYRTLDKLEALNKITKIHTLSNLSTYEISKHNHLHVECEVCHKVNCFDYKLCENDLKNISGKLLKKGFKITTHNFSLSGICRDCELKKT